MLTELHGLFPHSVRVVELSDPARAAPLYPNEEPAVARAVDKRKVEFALGRTAARMALAELGIAPGPLLPQPDRSVGWPSTAWGSITHADGFCAAIAALRRDHAGVGIDAEVRARVRPELWGHVASPREITWFESAASDHEAAERATLLFSAKEAFYKAQFCVSAAWVGFHDVELAFESPDRFVVELLVDVTTAFRKGERFAGKYALSAHHALTGIVLAPRA